MGSSLGGFIAQIVVAKEPTSSAGGPHRHGAGRRRRRRQHHPALVGDMLRGLFTRKDPKRSSSSQEPPTGKAAATAYMSRLRNAPRTASIAPRPRASPRRSWPFVAGAHWTRWTWPRSTILCSSRTARTTACCRRGVLRPRAPSAERVAPDYPDAGHGGVFQHHEQFVPHVLEFLR